MKGRILQFLTSLFFLVSCSSSQFSSSPKPPTTAAEATPTPPDGTMNQVPAVGTSTPVGTQIPGVSVLPTPTPAQTVLNGALDVVNIDVASCNQVQYSDSVMCQNNEVVHGINHVQNVNRFLQCCPVKSSKGVVFQKGTCSTAPFYRGKRAVCESGMFLTGIDFKKFQIECCTMQANGSLLVSTPVATPVNYTNYVLNACGNNQVLNGVGDERYPDTDVDQLFCTTYSLPK